ncbi:MAG: PCMD domain-containing protein [Chitinophagales bacterium]|nr:PCMD domain-containing protein [Chitinophagales bacterium]
MTKKFLLPLLLMFAVGLNAQIVNNSFENWVTDTIFFPGINTVPPDTFESPNPADWTSSNSLSGTDSLGGVFFVTETNDAYHGNSAVNIITDTINLPTIPNFPLLKLTFPGFVVNGKFPINTETLLTSGSVISPLSILGAGQPFTQKLHKIKGYYKYAPVFNPNTNNNDTCVVWATLRKGTQLIGEAIFKSTSATSGYQPFEATFNYYSCDNPDTLVVFMASSVPNVQAILGGGASGLVRGSVLKVDSVYYETLPGNYNFPAIAVNDVDTTFKNTPKNILVKLNDEDCDDPVSGLTINVISQPVNGTATASGTSHIVYTPSTGFFGIDTFSYTLTGGGTTSAPANVKILVLNSSGINNTSEIPVVVFPVPANNEITVQLNYNGKAVAQIYDAVGRLVKTESIYNNSTVIGLHDVANGTYNLQIVSEAGVAIARTKFTVAK